MCICFFFVCVNDLQILIDFRHNVCTHIIYIYIYIHICSIAKLYLALSQDRGQLVSILNIMMVRSFYYATCFSLWMFSRQVYAGNFASTSLSPGKERAKKLPFLTRPQNGIRHVYTVHMYAWILVCSYTLMCFDMCVCCLCYYVVVVIFANGIRWVTTMYTTRVDQAITNDDQVW